MLIKNGEVFVKRDEARNFLMNATGCSHDSAASYFDDLSSIKSRGHRQCYGLITRYGRDGLPKYKRGGGTWYKLEEVLIVMELVPFFRYWRGDVRST